MLDTLIEKSSKLQQELLDLERDFNIKKELFIRHQGAIEALQIVIQEEDL